MITYLWLTAGTLFFFDLNQPKIEDCLYPQKYNLQKKQKGKREKKRQTYEHDRRPINGIKKGKKEKKEQGRIGKKRKEND
jgi:hypothetical protein